MKKEYMQRMTASELDDYAQALGIETTPAKSPDDKIGIIERKRERKARVRVLGCDIDIPIKVMRDPRISFIFDKQVVSDKEMSDGMRMILGEEQYQLLEEVCTDDDGVIDGTAFGYACAKIITSPELKNF